MHNIEIIVIINNSPNATVDVNNFGNNAFSNLAPLLTLFSNEVTKQFLANPLWFPDTLLRCHENAVVSGTLE